VPTVVHADGIDLKVYPSEVMRHRAPHFHVWIGGESVSSVSLLDFKPFIGKPLSRKVRRLCEENRELLWEKWEELNG
jgi:hypothetical protein